MKDGVVMSMTRRSLLPAILASLALCGTLVPAMGKNPSVPDDEAAVPSRPPGAELSTQEGILLRYAVRARAGTLTLKMAQGQEITFRLSLPIRIDGHDVACKPLPSSAPAAPDTCPDWPANIAVGYTHVRVIYWQAARPGTKENVQVISEIKALGTSAALPGTTRVNVR